MYDDRKDEATRCDVMTEEVLVPRGEHLVPGGVSDRFRQSSGRLRLVSSPLWSLRLPLVSALKIIGKAGLSFEGELVCRRSCTLLRKGSGARLENELSAVVWSLAESWLGWTEPLDRVRRVMDTPVHHVPLSSSNSL